MNAVIIEDEKASSEYLGNTLKRHFPYIEISAVCAHVQDAIDALVNHQPHIVFLDVEIKGGTGFDVLTATKGLSFGLVFTTAFDRFAVDAFRHCAVDYLLKPLQAVQIKKATERCMQQAAGNVHAASVAGLLTYVEQQHKQNVKIGIHTPEGIELLETTDIIYAEAKSNYTDLWLKSGRRITAARKLKEIEQSLPGDRFFRIHHSFVVNIQYVARYQRGRGGYIVLQDDKALPVSSGRKDEFLTWLK